ncbi:hypothetical protein Taro_021619 [Colocasia esculenta]|uniref:Uncharacterized protein n=1 Tax=Colocasia esculenta TaxID=4460 RepID=A0A843UZB4_COLES|nr:hypothetical protein [Colocasia esculenta]
MEDWRRARDWGDEEQKGRGEVGWGQQQHPAGAARSSNSKPGKPPPAPGSWQPTIPSWEKRFCTSVCRIPWRRICETKRLMSYYSNVLDWDDSAGKEAFDNAKSRFFAKINGLTCDISLPGPDIYIDEIDWDAEIDPQLLLDLDKEFVPADMEGKDGKIGFLSSGWDRAIPCTGWGDAEDVTSPVRDAWTESGWTNSGENGGNVEGWDRTNDWGGGAVDSSGWDNGDWNNNSGWGAGARNDSSGWGAGTWNDNSGWGAGEWEVNPGQITTGWEDNTGWGNGCWEKNFQWQGGAWEKPLDNKGPSDSWQHQDNNRNHQMGYWDPKRGTRKREGDGPYGSRSPAIRHQKDGFCQPSNNHWRNSRGRKRTNYQSEQPTFHEPLVPRQWNAMRSYGPRSRYGSAAAGGGG